jgi:DNA repair protein RadC
MKSTSHFINELSVNYSRKEINHNSIKNSADVYNLIKVIYNNTQSAIELKEYFFMILLNRVNKVIGYYKLSEGGISGTVVDLRLAFGTALKGLASGIIMAHNHPSGNLFPSEEDKRITKKFTEAGKILDITVLDHLIVTADSYFSFADEGIL